MEPKEFKELIDERGYAFGDSTVLRELITLHLGVLKQGGLLKPKSVNETQNTHSGMFGLGEFPWHTDGAVSNFPPRWLILNCILAKAHANTELYLPRPHELDLLKATVLRSQNSLGQVRYLPAISQRNGTPLVRWDPRACPPIGSTTADPFANATPDVSIEWSEGKTLVVDNYKYLHRRTRVSGGLERVINREYVF